MLTTRRVGNGAGWLDQTACSLCPLQIEGRWRAKRDTRANHRRGRIGGCLHPLLAAAEAVASARRLYL